jgi:hypothetical protein
VWKSYQCPLTSCGTIWRSIGIVLKMESRIQEVIQLFFHYDNPGKCEWVGGALDAFALHYNEQSGTDYFHTACLDVVQISGLTPKAPEVLLTDAATGRQMVIERKSVTWPREYIHRHQPSHGFADTIGKKTSGLFLDAPYILKVKTRQLNQLSGKAIKEASETIGGIVAGLTPSDLPRRSKEPISWSLRKALPGEDQEERKGLTIIEKQSISFDDLDNEEAKVGTTAEINIQLRAAALKFEGNAGQRRLVLLDFYGEELTEDDIPLLFGGITIPEAIDEVWRTVRDWISHNDYKTGYNRLSIRPGL